MPKNYTINGHNSFYVREGWISKGLRFLKNKEVIETTLFSKNNTDSIDELGLGSMMVTSLRFWLQAFGIVKKSTYSTFEMNNDLVSILNKDPYLQKINTLLILHYSALTVEFEKNLIWETVFEKDPSYNNFTKDELILYVDIDAKEKGLNAAKKVISDSVTVFLRTYVNEELLDPEDNLSSPFARLNYLSYDSGIYKFRHLDYNEFSEYVILYILFEKLNEFNTVKQITIDDAYKIIYKIIKISYLSFEKIIGILEKKKELSIDRAAGLENIIFKDTSKIKILEKIMADERE